MSPAFQRKSRVWSDRDKSFLINSIINGYDIPKIYLADFSGFHSALQQNNVDFAVIDGKQRLASIFEFFSNAFILDEDFVYEPEPDLEIRGLKYSEIVKRFPRIAEKIEVFHLSVVTVETNDDVKIRELFRRLNSGKPLQGAEIRNAQSGAVAYFARQLSNHDFFQKSISLNTTRMQEFDIATVILMFEYSGKIIDTKRKQIEDFIALKDSIDDRKITRAYERAVDDLDSMYNTFYYKDPVLRIKSMIITFYLFSQQMSLYGEDLRDFFKYFLETYRRRNKSNLLSSHEKNLMATFATYARNINDAGSIQERVNILKEHYRIWKSMKLF